MPQITPEEQKQRDDIALAIIREGGSPSQAEIDERLAARQVAGDKDGSAGVVRRSG